MIVFLGFWYRREAMFVGDLLLGSGGYALLIGFGFRYLAFCPQDGLSPTYILLCQTLVSLNRVLLQP